MTDQARLIRIHPADNVAIVANDGGLPEGAQIDGLTLRQAVPQAHKVALRELAAGDPVRRYGVVIGFAKGAIPAGGWVNEASLDMPQAPDLDGLSKAQGVPAEIEPLDGYTFQGFRNADGSVGTRNILAITNTVQCVSGIVGHAVERLRREVLPHFPNVDDVVALDHTYGCGVAIEAPGAAVPIRTLHNIARMPEISPPPPQKWTPTPTPGYNATPPKEQPSPHQFTPPPPHPPPPPPPPPRPPPPPHPQSSPTTPSQLTPPGHPRHPKRPLQEHLQSRKLSCPQTWQRGWQQLGGRLQHGRECIRRGDGND